MTREVVLVPKNGRHGIVNAEVGALGLPPVLFQTRYMGPTDYTPGATPRACEDEVQQVRFELNGVTADPTPGVRRNLPAYEEVADV